MNKPKEPHWIVHSHLFSSDEYECSECGAMRRDTPRKCPCCGAKLLKIFDQREWIDEAEEIQWMLDDD